LTGERDSLPGFHGQIDNDGSQDDQSANPPQRVQRGDDIINRMMKNHAERDEHGGVKTRSHKIETGENQPPDACDTSHCDGDVRQSGRRNKPHKK
jgi:hypothetical protein